MTVVVRMMVLGVVGLQSGLYLYPRTRTSRSLPGDSRSELAGCSARPGCGCSSTSLVSLHSGDVVRLEVDTGLIANSEFNSFVMYLVEDHRAGGGRCTCRETCQCNCDNDCCHSDSQAGQGSGYSGQSGSGYSGQSGSGYSGQSGSGYSGQTDSGYSGQSGSGYSGQSGSGYSGQSDSGYSGQSGSGYSGQSDSGYYDGPGESGYRTTPAQGIGEIIYITTPR